MGFGFRPIVEGEGFMRNCIEPDFDERQFARCEPQARDLLWRDWAPLTALLGITTGSWVRNVAYSVIGPKNFEGGFMKVMADGEEGDQVYARVLEGPRPCSVVGFATLRRDQRWPGVWLLDMFTHPNFADHAALLLPEDFEVKGKIQAFVDADDSPRRSALESAGFGVEATLRRQVDLHGKVVDVVVCAKEA